MPNTREKLIELFFELQNECYSIHCNECEYFGKWRCLSQWQADHIIADGVMVQKWIPLAEQKPNRDDLVIVFFEGMRDTPAAIQIMYGWCIGGSATHWMPLPEPPKGE